MNGKQAKRLRIKAKALTKGFVPTNHKRNANTQALELVSGCTRNVYQQLKKQYKSH